MVREIQFSKQLLGDHRENLILSKTEQNGIMNSMTKRIKIPYKIQLKLLAKNKHICCICRELRSSPEVQIHHIDGNPSNNNLDNLAVLCGTHHNLAKMGLKRGDIGQSKKLTPGLVKRFKKEWETKIETEIKVTRRVIPIRERKQLEILYKFEISKRKNEILSLAKEQRQTIKNNYEFLQQLCLEEVVTGLKLRPIILEAYSDISFQCVWRDHIALPLVDAVRNLFPHLVGPEHVRIHSDDKKLLLKSLNILETVGCWGAEFSDNTELLIKACKTVHEMATVASWYKFSDFLTKAIQTLNSIKKDCLRYTPDKKEQNGEKLVEDRIKIVEDIISSINKFR